MAAERPQFESRADIEAQVDALRRRGRHIAPVRWQGGPAWLKLSVPEPPAWRYQIQGAVARVLGVSALQPVRPLGGAAGIRNEAARLDALARGRGPGSPVLVRAEHWLLMSELGHTTLESLILNAGEEAGPRTGAQARPTSAACMPPVNISASPSRVTCSGRPRAGSARSTSKMIPMTAMSLVEAQMRDWMPYFYSTAVYFEAALPGCAPRSAPRWRTRRPPCAKVSRGSCGAPPGSRSRAGCRVPCGVAMS